MTSSGQKDSVENYNGEAGKYIKKGGDILHSTVRST